MDDLIVGLLVIGAALAFFLLFVYKGGLKAASGATAGGTSAQSATSFSSIASRPPKPAKAVGNKPAPAGGGAPVPLQGISGVAVPISEWAGGSNPYSALSTFSQGVGAAAAEYPFSPNPGVSKVPSPPGSRPIAPAAVNRGTVGDTAPALNPKTHQNLAIGPAGIYTTLQRTLGSLG